MRHRLAATLTIGALLALPATAAAQNAGDEQYGDPFGGVEQPEDNGGGSTGSDGSGTPSTSTAPSADPVVQDTAPAQANAESGSGLPRTGFPAAVAAVLGVLMLTCGISIRRRSAPPLAIPRWVTPGASRRRFRARRRR